MKDAIKRTVKAVGLWLLQGILGCIFVLGFAYLLVEWVSGCGEHYIDANGNTHINQCLLPPITK